MPGKEILVAWQPAEHDGICVGAPGDGELWCSRQEHFRVKEKWRGHYVPAPAYFTLNHCCRLLNDAFGSFGCYLVGSALERRDFRDVDIRYIMDDARYKTLFHDEGGWTNAMWSLMCMTISLWLSQQTGLQVDFQIQSQSHANREHKGVRSAMGIFLDYPGEPPTDVNAHQAG